MRRKKERQPNFVMSLERRHSSLLKIKALRGKASKPKPNFVMSLERRHSGCRKSEALRGKAPKPKLAEAERAACCCPEAADLAAQSRNRAQKLEQEKRAMSCRQEKVGSEASSRSKLWMCMMHDAVIEKKLQKAARGQTQKGKDIVAR